MPTPPADERFNRPQAADYLGVKVPTLAADVVNQRHKFPFVKVGRRCVYIRSQLDKWIADHTHNAPAATV